MEVRPSQWTGDTELNLQRKLRELKEVAQVTRIKIEYTRHLKKECFVRGIVEIRPTNESREIWRKLRRRTMMLMVDNATPRRVRVEYTIPKESK